jgi:ferredoxin
VKYGYVFTQFDSEKADTSQVAKGKEKEKNHTSEDLQCSSDAARYGR